MGVKFGLSYFGCWGEYLDLRDRV